jgi:cytidylate kinase
MYRAITLKALRLGVGVEDHEALEDLAARTELDVIPQADKTRVLLDGEDVTDRIRRPEVSQAASPVSAAPGVRARMVEIQRRIGSRGGLVAEGRDMGSVVFPEAGVKIYLKADLATRALRRKLEMGGSGEEVALEDVRRQLESRDAYDSARANSPLVIPEGAVIVDTSDLSIEEQVERVIAEVRKRESAP